MSLSPSNPSAGDPRGRIFDVVVPLPLTEVRARLEIAAQGGTPQPGERVQVAISGDEFSISPTAKDPDGLRAYCSGSLEWMGAGCRVTVDSSRLTRGARYAVIGVTAFAAVIAAVVAASGLREGNGALAVAAGAFVVLWALISKLVVSNSTGAAEEAARAFLRSALPSGADIRRQRHHQA